MLGPTLEAAVTTLIRSGRADAGAALLGYIATHHPDPLGTSRRAEIRTELHDVPGADQHLARGETMDRDTAVAYAITQLADIES